MSTSAPEPGLTPLTGPVSAPAAVPAAAAPVAVPVPGPVPVPAPPRPDGVSETEWAALGDPGKAALVRERARATTAEHQLAEARRLATAPAPGQPAPPAPPKHAAPAGPNSEPDIATLIQDAVQKAIAPIQEAAAQREATTAVAAIRDAVTTAARDHFHDPSDALAGLDLTTLTDGTGRADPTKVAAALNDLLARKPHLGKAVDPRRQAVPGALVGAGGPSGAPLEDRVKAQLELMKQQH